MKSIRSGLGVTTLSLAALAAGYFGARPILDRVEFAAAESRVQDTRQELSTVEDLSTVFRHVAEVMEPSVVRIKVTKEQKVAQNPQDFMLHKFFEQNNGPMPMPMPFGDNGGGDGQQEFEQVSTGSGVIMAAEDGTGYILTNNHVAGDGGSGSSFQVSLSDGRTVKGKLLGADPKSDLAVVEIKADRLIPAKWGNSDELQRGDWVLAFGSPFGYIGSMTHGIVSALHRDGIDLPQENASFRYENFIQVDAPINPGNSGGPLVNIRGEVVGIDTAIATAGSGGSVGVGFAIPSNQAKMVYDGLRNGGKVVRGYLGIQMQSLDSQPGLAKSFGYTGDSQVLVAEVIPGGPAAGKLKVGDVVLGFNGTPITTMGGLQGMVAVTAPNTNVTIRVYRDGQEKDIDLTLGTQPDQVALNGGGDDSGTSAAAGSPEGAKAAKTLGLGLTTLDEPTARQLNLGSQKDGALITDVAPGSAAASAGLSRGDVITKVNGLDIHTAADAAQALQKADLAKGVRLYVTTPPGQGGGPTGRDFVFLQQGGED